MQALRWHAAGDVRVEDVPEPGAPEPGMAVVEVAACGICGSDLAEFRGGPKMIRTTPHPLTGRMAPLTLGHEFVGRVVAASDEAAWPSGTRVTADACWRCGRCEACAAGDYHMCRYGGSIGLHSDGAFARFVAVPEYTLVRVPDGVSDQAAAMTEPLAVGLHALDRGGTRAADPVLVLGFGPIGAAAALLARALGASPYVVELDGGRRARAEALGLATLDVGDDLPRRVRRAMGGGGATVVIESTGAPPVLPQAVECARRGGRIVAVGLTGAPSPLDSSRLTFYERSLVGSLGYRHDLPRVIRMVADGLVDPVPLVSATVSLAAAPETFASLASTPGDRVKVMVDPCGGR
jgi:(R,R)-butanediol dehydrogenase / meso-butanediol dehydrogenase / diacetyl reductase